MVETENMLTYIATFQLHIGQYVKVVVKLNIDIKDIRRNVLRLSCYSSKCRRQYVNFTG